MLQIVSQLTIKSPCVYRPPLLVSDVVFMSLPLLKTTFLMIKLSPTSWLPISLSLSLVYLLLTLNFFYCRLPFHPLTPISELIIMVENATVDLSWLSYSYLFPQPK